MFKGLNMGNYFDMLEKTEIYQFKNIQSRCGIYLKVVARLCLKHKLSTRVTVLRRKKKQLTINLIEKSNFFFFTIRKNFALLVLVFSYDNYEII